MQARASLPTRLGTLRRSSGPIFLMEIQRFAKEKRVQSQDTQPGVSTAESGWSPEDHRQPPPTGLVLTNFLPGVKTCLNDENSNSRSGDHPLITNHRRPYLFLF